MQKSNCQNNECLIGRQPILDRNLNIFGYELLYRSSYDNFASFDDDNEATLDVFMKAFPNAGLQSLVGHKMAFINLTRGFLTGQFPIPLLPHQVILEILEDVEPDYEVIIGIRELTSKGYVFAVDDLVTLEKWNIPIANLATYAKVDVSLLSNAEISDLVHNLKQKPIKLIAEKVETRELYRRCMGLGFDFFQGYFFCEPEIIELHKLDSSKAVILQVLISLQKPDMKLRELEKFISMDVTLVLSLLKVVNSGYYSLPVTITSVRHAIALIGGRQLRNWLSFFLMARVRNKPYVLCQQALLRAKAAENFAWAMKVPNPDQYFLAGLFTVLDTLMDAPMEKILADLNLDPEVTTAILEGKGQIGAVLRAIRGFETYKREPILELGVNFWKLSSLYLNALNWTETILSTTLSNQSK